MEREMKVAELITALKDMDQNATVHMVYDYGDHWHTKVAPEIKVVDYGEVVHSEYHKMPKMVDEDDERPKGEIKEVVLLKLFRF